MTKVYIVGAKRTPIGKINKALADHTASQLGSYAISGLLAQTAIDRQMIDEVMIGTVLQANQGQNPARQAAMLAELPVSIPAITINDVCGSGLSAINLAAHLIAAGSLEVMIAGGMESMTHAPYLVDKQQAEAIDDKSTLIDALQRDALCDPFEGYSMAQTAENMAERYDVSREQMDAFALASHQKAVAAAQTGAFDSEIVPVLNAQNESITKDETPRPDTSLERLSTLKTLSADGQITAGNASPLNDGAAMVMLASEAAVREHHLTPLAEWVDEVTVGVEADYMGEGPIKAIDTLLAQQALAVDDVDYFEINEAFAAQVIADQKTLHIPDEKLNPRGGSLALGHPLGASGARILTTLIYELRDQQKTTGVASLCVGGGMGVATLIKAVD